MTSGRLHVHFSCTDNAIFATSKESYFKDYYYSINESASSTVLTVIVERPYKTVP